MDSLSVHIDLCARDNSGACAHTAQAQQPPTMTSVYSWVYTEMLCISNWLVSITYFFSHSHLTGRLQCLLSIVNGWPLYLVVVNDIFDFCSSSEQCLVTFSISALLYGTHFTLLFCVLLTANTWHTAWRWNCNTRAFISGVMKQVTLD